jgi:hypothetical protein
MYGFVYASNRKVNASRNRFDREPVAKVIFNVIRNSVRALIAARANHVFKHYVRCEHGCNVDNGFDLLLVKQRQRVVSVLKLVVMKRQGMNAFGKLIVDLYHTEHQKSNYLAPVQKGNDYIKKSRLANVPSRFFGAATFFDKRSVGACAGALALFDGSDKLTVYAGVGSAPGYHFTLGIVKGNGNSRCLIKVIHRSLKLI